MKRIFSLLAALALLLACLGTATAEEAGVVVKNYKQLADAVNEQHATRILVSPRYKHGTKDVINLYPEGRTVTLLPENGESAVINGRVDICGPGTVVFENVSIAGPAGDAGLWIGDDADVTIGSVTGGKAKRDNGFPAVIVEDARLTIDSAVGSEGRGGFGGDGIYALGNSTVKVREAVGGSAKKGFGGSGVVALGGASVTVEGSAAGGDGLYAAGKGALIGLDGVLSGEGTVADGAELEGRKTLDPENVSSLILLEHALRSGRTDILLDPRFRAGEGFTDDLVLFCAGADPVRISNASDEKPATLDHGLRFYTGTWQLENLRFSLSAKDWTACLWVTGNASVTASGSMAAKGEATGIYASIDGRIEYTGDCTSADYAAYARNNAAITFNGNIALNGKGNFGAGTDGGTVTVNGDITVTGDSNALASFGGKLEMTGSVRSTKNKAYPTLYISGGELVVNGPVSSESQASAIYCKGGSVTVNGDVNSTTQKKYPVFLDTSAGDVTINGTLTAVHTAIRADGGSATVNGDLIIRSRENWSLTSWNNDATVTVTGESKIVAP